MEPRKSRFSRKTRIGLSTISESSSEWVADFKNANQIFLAYKNFDFKNSSCLYKIYFILKYLDGPLLPKALNTV